MMQRLFIAGLLVALAVYLSEKGNSPEPEPAPIGLSLTACFQGEDAARDAATVAAMADEIASVIEWDAKQDQPLMTTGFAIDQMRTKTREMLCRGVSLGEKHPLVCEAVCAFLDQRVGNNGGVLTDEDRKNWVQAYRDIARAARATIQ